MDNQTVKFLRYLVAECIDKCEVDPEKTTVADFVKAVEEACTPVGF